MSARGFWRGVDVAYGSAGEDTFAGSLACLGRLVNFGQASGPVPPFEVAQLAARSNTLLRPIIFHYRVDLAYRARLTRSLVGAAEEGIARGEPSVEYTSREDAPFCPPRYR
jgi:NADPH2:quinone reductase